MLKNHLDFAQPELLNIKDMLLNCEDSDISQQNTFLGEVEYISYIHYTYEFVQRGSISTHI